MAYNNLGALLITKDQLPEAISLIEIAAHRSSIPAAHYDLGLALFKSGRNDEAIASYQRALDLKPRYPEAHYNLALALVKSGRTEEATAHYEEALRIKPDYAEPHNGLGLVLASAGACPTRFHNTRLRSGLIPPMPVSMKTWEWPCFIRVDWTTPSPIMSRPSSSDAALAKRRTTLALL